MAMSPTDSLPIPSSYHSLHEPDMIAWTRLPTPIPHDLLSPPQSAASSPRLSISTAPSNTASSSFALPSPLPSPLEPSSSGSKKQEQCASVSTPSGSKTAAFFASPFASAGPPTPAPPPKRSVSLDVHIESATPKVQTIEPEPTPTSSRSATADFFSSNGFTSSWRPTPPPSLNSSASSNASSSSREPSPPRLPPISRFFPSRYTSEARRATDDDEVQDGGVDDGRAGGVRDGYGDLLDGGDDVDRRFDRDHTRNGQKKRLVPSTGDWETSFKRAFLSLAKRVDPTHTHHTHVSTSPTQERMLSSPTTSLSLRRDAAESTSSDTVIVDPASSSYPLAPGNESGLELERIPHPLLESGAPCSSNHQHLYSSSFPNGHAQPTPSALHLQVGLASQEPESTHVSSHNNDYNHPNAHSNSSPLPNPHPPSHLLSNPHSSYLPNPHTPYYTHLPITQLHQPHFRVHSHGHGHGHAPQNNPHHPIRRETQHHHHPHHRDNRAAQHQRIDTNGGTVQDYQVSEQPQSGVTDRLPVSNNPNTESNEKSGQLVYDVGSILCADLGEASDKNIKTNAGDDKEKVETSNVKLKLERPLGEGAFSSVWLASDVSGELARALSRSLSRSRSRKGKHSRNSSSASASAPMATISSGTSTRMGAQRGSGQRGVGVLGAGLRRKSESRAKRGSDSKRMRGIRPTANVGASVGLTDEGGGHLHPPESESEAEIAGEMRVRRTSTEEEGSVDESNELLLDEMHGEGASVVGAGAAGARVEMFAPANGGGGGGGGGGILGDSDLDGRGDDVEGKGQLVAVKMMNRALCDANDRTRISFVREVEVLRHISHPSIVSYLHSFTTLSHHVLVLEYVGGGELFTLVNSDTEYTRVTEPAIRRMWGELARAVGWMHGVGLVHRDIKLENILLTRNVFASASGSGEVQLPPVQTPLVKLTDFGLSRFIDPAAPLLSTRCGSEAYAAPELVLRRPIGAGAQGSAGGGEGYYDGRQTDAWACGVVLYALATRQLPFDNPPPWLPASNAPSRAGSLKSQNGREARAGTPGSGRVNANNNNNAAGAQPQPQTQTMSVEDQMAQSKARREMLMRIAQCEYWWPDEAEAEGYYTGWEPSASVSAFASTLSISSACSDDGHEASPSSPSYGRDQESRRAGDGAGREKGMVAQPELEPTPTARLSSAGLKAVVRRLLVRDPAKRARLVEVWDEPWMRGEGAPAPPAVALKKRESVRSLKSATSNGGSGDGLGEEKSEGKGGWELMEECAEGCEGEEEEGDAEEEEEGMLLDGEHIDSVATQEFEPL